METAYVSSILYSRNHGSTNRNRAPFRDHKHAGTTRIHLQSPRSRINFIRSSKQSDFQDFQGYAKPSRLLPASKVKIHRNDVAQDKILLSSFIGDQSRCFYKVELKTSSMYDSSLSNVNAGILLCFIDENGDSILQRFPSTSASLYAELGDLVGSESSDTDMFHFQRGSVDVFTFEGLKLGRIAALWVSLESGQWRLCGVRLSVITAYQASKEDTGDEKIQYVDSQYNFEVEDLLLGEGSNVSMVELKPVNFRESFNADLVTLLSTKSVSQSTSLSNDIISNKQSMKDYADLKLSLLLYDVILVLVGSTIANLSIGDNAAFAFFMGGIGGFLYLLLLQRFVDGLQVPSSTGSDEQFGGFKNSSLGIVVAVGFTLLAVRYNSEVLPMALTPKDLLLGMMGFIACKVAVVLAALKPVPLGSKEIKLQ